MTKTQRFHLVLTPAQAKSLKDASAKTGIPASEIVRRALDRELIRMAKK